MEKIFEKKSLKYISILIIITLLTIFFRAGINSKRVYYQNYDATYHTLLTIKAYSETPVSQHHFLPIVTLGNKLDKYIWWGATIPDKYGNYYYTSFPFGGFVFPYFFFKVFKLNETINNMYIFSSLILLISVFLFYTLTKKIALFFEVKNSDRAAIFSSIIYIFSLETFYSHGYIYWPHSLFQILYIMYFILCFSLFTEKERNKKKNFIKFFIISFFLCSVEWSGYTTVFTTIISFFIFSKIKKEDMKCEIMGVALGSILALSIFILIFISTVDSNLFFETVKARFMDRNFSDNISYMELIKGYLNSFHYFLLLIPLGIFGLLKIKKEYLNVAILYFIILLGGILENILMKQHAAIYHFDRLKILLIFPIVIVLIFKVYKEKLLKFLIVLIIFSSIYTMYVYPSNRVIRNNFFIKNEEISKKVKDECSESLIGTNIAVRGHFNLLFNRNIYENIDIERLNKIALDRGVKSFCFINSRYGFSSQPKLNSFIKLNTSFEKVFFITDSNWKRGISRTKAGFFVKNDLENRNKYKVGKKIKINNNDIRIIEKIEAQNGYLNIWLSGKILEADKLDYPNKFEVIEK